MAWFGFDGEGPRRGKQPRGVIDWFRLNGWFFNFWFDFDSLASAWLVLVWFGVVCTEVALAFWFAWETDELCGGFV